MNRVSLSQATPTDLLETWREAIVARYGPDADSDPVLCGLLNFLDAYGWQGSARKIIEAMPVRSGRFEFEDMRNALARLGIKTIPYTLSTNKVPESLCPCLYANRFSRNPSVILGRDGNKLIRATPEQIGEQETVDRLPPGSFYLVEDAKAETRQGADGARQWLRNVINEFRPVAIWAFVMAFLINVLSLVGPLSIMLIYDQVIAKESLATLDWLILGVGIAVAFELGLRILRARCQAYIGAKLDYRIGTKVFEQILHLPPIFTERAPVGGQVTRIREFDGFREVFSGPLAGIALDLPFTLLFVLVLFWLGGPLALIPVVLAALYVGLARLVVPVLRERTRRSGAARSNRYSFLVELMWGMRSIKQLDGANIWRNRFRGLSADASWANYDVGRLHASTMSLAQTIMFLSGVATLGFGVMRVNEGAMSLGALIATMMLVWRILGPIQTLLSLAYRVEQLQQSFRQLTDLLGYRREQEPGEGPAIPIKFRGQITFNRVSMRYSHDSNPSLLGVSFAARPGELIGIAGESGAGKSTLAKLAMGLYQPQGGSVMLDGIDLRQLKPITLRQTLAYVPQKNHAFPGTLYDNIRMADPTASMERVRQACKMAGILHKIEVLPDGFETSFRDGLQSHVPQGFLRQLALARAFLVDAPIYVLDEPTSSMDEEDERYFLRALEILRGDRTVLMVTQRPSHMLLCDRLIYLDHGQLRYSDDPQTVLDNVFQKRPAGGAQAVTGPQAAGQPALTARPQS